MNTGRYALAFPKDGKLELVINTDRHLTFESACLSLSDRVCNGEAFPQEQVVQLWVHLQWFAGYQDSRPNLSSYFYVKAIPEGVRPCIIDAIVALNTLQQLCRADAKGIYFNSPDMATFDGSATGYWEQVAKYYGATADEIEHAKNGWKPLPVS